MINMQYQSWTYLRVRDKQKSRMTKEQVFNGHKFRKYLIGSWGIIQSKRIGEFHVQSSIGTNSPGYRKPSAEL